VLSDLPKKRLTRDDFSVLLPPLASAVKKHFHTRYYLDTSDNDQPRLGLFVVDFGQKLRNIARKVRREIERRGKNDFSEVIGCRLLTVCVLTGHEKKAEQIRRALSDLPLPLRVEAVPGYAQLLLFKD
jgi:hypothetical protein